MLDEQRNYVLPTREGLAQIRQMYDNNAQKETAPVTLNEHDHMMKAVVEAVHRCYKKKERYGKIWASEFFKGISSSLDLSTKQKELVHAVVKEMNDSGCYIARCPKDACNVVFFIVDMDDVPMEDVSWILCSSTQGWSILGLAVFLMAGPFGIVAGCCHHVVLGIAFVIIWGVSLLTFLAIFGFETDWHLTKLNLHLQVPPTRTVADVPKPINPRDSFDTFFAR